MGCVIKLYEQPKSNNTDTVIKTRSGTGTGTGTGKNPKCTGIVTGTDKVVPVVVTGPFLNWYLQRCSTDSPIIGIILNCGVDKYCTQRKVHDYHILLLFLYSVCGNLDLQFLPLVKG